MSGKLLDTGVLIDLIPGRSSGVARRFSDEIAAGAPLVVSAISVFEYRYGAARAAQPEAQLTALERILSVVDVIAFAHEDGEAAALIRRDPAASGRMIGPYDLLIASQAFARGMTLVTSNAREFARVDNLAIEDWREA